MLGKHLLGLYEKALDPKDDWRTRLRKARELGFDYVEISIDESDERLARLDWSRDEIEDLRRICHEEGVEIRSMCLSAHRRFPFGSRDPKIRQRAHEIMEKALDLAGGLGIRVIQLAGYDVYYEPSTPESERLFREAMNWCAKKAEQKQVMLAMEIMDTPFLNSISKHMGYEAGYELTRGIGSIVAVHLKDTIAPVEGRPGTFKCVPFGEGCVDFRKCFGLLERLGYEGPYMIEMWFDENGDEFADVTKAKNWLTEQFNKGTE